MQSTYYLKLDLTWWYDHWYFNIIGNERMNIPQRKEKIAYGRMFEFSRCFREENDVKNNN